MFVKRINNSNINFNFLLKNKIIFYNNNRSINFHFNRIRAVNKVYAKYAFFNLYKKFVLFFCMADNFYFTKINLIGLGFKNFVFRERLHILIGDCNYLLLNIPKEVEIFCKKNQVYGLSTDKSLLFDFFSSLKSLKKINYYKGKGILEFNNFKFMKLKVGKKQKT
jgi:hypothetical protein